MGYWYLSWSSSWLLIWVAVIYSFDIDIDFSKGLTHKNAEESFVKNILCQSLIVIKEYLDRGLIIDNDHGVLSQSSLCIPGLHETYDCMICVCVTTPPIINMCVWVLANCPRYRQPSTVLEWCPVHWTNSATVISESNLYMNYLCVTPHRNCTPQKTVLKSRRTCLSLFNCAGK